MNDSQFIAQTVPTNMVAGIKYPVTITFKNIGDTTWTAAASYRVGMQKPSWDSTVFGPSRFYLDPGVSVAPGAMGAFKAELTGPAAATYQFQARTVQDGPGSWFGASTATLNIVVAAGAPPMNLPPAVNAGVDQTVVLPASAALAGTASDPEGKPLVIAWTKVSGPGTVTFSMLTALSTLATFSIDGVYVLRLTASDGVKASSDEITVTVQAADDVLTLEIGGPLTLKWIDNNGVEQSKNYKKFNVIVRP